MDILSKILKAVFVDRTRFFIWRSYNLILWSVIPIIFYQNFLYLIIVIGLLVWSFRFVIFRSYKINRLHPNIKMKTKRVLSFIFDIVIINLAIMVIYHVVKFFCLHCSIYLCALYITMILLKDSFGKPSIGHKLMDLCICVNGKQISPTVAFLRNIFYLIWPADFLCFLISQKRIGDYIFKSEVVDSSQYKGTRDIISLVKSVILFICVLSIMFVFSYFLVMKYPILLL